MIDPFGSTGRLLAIAAHPDDIELGAGATISRLIRQGWTVHTLVLSTSAESLPAGLPKDAAVEECKRSLRGLGVQSMSFQNMPVRRFPEYRQQILDCLIAERSAYQPTLVIGPSACDIHQDHQTVAIEMQRAFQPKVTVLGYDMPWNGETGDPTILVEVTEIDITAKLAALANYGSQIAKSVDYFEPNFVRSLAVVRAARSPFALAERFTVRTMLAAGPSS